MRKHEVFRTTETSTKLFEGCSSGGLFFQSQLPENRTEGPAVATAPAVKGCIEATKGGCHNH